MAAIRPTDAPDHRVTPRKAITATLALLAFGLLWLALPALALAGDCPDDTGAKCLIKWAAASPALAMAAGALILGAALWRGLSSDFSELSKDWKKTRDAKHEQDRVDKIIDSPPYSADDFKNAPPQAGQSRRK